jgi:drug/metabolite transporter (DMT)-like permease
MAAAVAFNHGIARIPAARVAQLLGFMPVVGLLSAVLLLGERPAPLRLAGGAAILAGLLILLRAGGDVAHAAADPIGHPVPHQPSPAPSRPAPSTVEKVPHHD